MIQVFIVDDAPFSLANLRRLLTAENGMTVCGDAPDAASAMQRIGACKPDVVLIDFDLPGLDSKSLVAQLGEMHPAPAVVALGVDDAAVAKAAALAQGAAVYVVKPYAGKQILEAITAVTEAHIRPASAEVAAPPPAAAGRQLIAFTAGKGGSGCTTLATNVALLLAIKSKKSTALIDLDFQNGNIARMLRLEEGPTVLDVLQKPAIMEQGKLLEFMAVAPGGARVLYAPGKPRLPSEVSPEAMDRLLVALRRLFEIIIVDIPPHLNAAAVTTLRAADMVMVVASMSDPAVHATKRQLGLLDLLRVSKDRLTLVLNRTEANSDIGKAEAERILQLPASCQFPYDPILVSNAVNRGVPFALQKPEAQVSRRIADLAALILPAGAGGPAGNPEEGEGRRQKGRKLFGLTRP